MEHRREPVTRSIAIQAKIFFRALIVVNQASCQARFYWNTCCAELNRNMAMVAWWAPPADKRDHGEAKTRGKRARCPPLLASGVFPEVSEVKEGGQPRLPAT